ncbi:MAG: hypothetical protein WAW86_01075 [Gammaproteobacteria bacterium]
MLRWLFFGSEKKDEVSVTQKILDELAVEFPIMSSIFKAYQHSPVEFNAALLASPTCLSSIKSFYESLRQDEALAFIEMLSDPVVEQVMDLTSEDEQQPFYFAEAKEKRAIAFIRKIPKSRLGQLVYLRNMSEIGLKASLFAALISESFPETENDWGIIQPLLLVRLEKKPTYFTKVIDALDPSVALHFIQTLPVSMVEHLVRFNSRGDDFIYLNDFYLDATISSALINRLSSGLAANILAKTYTLDKQKYNIVFSLRPSLLVVFANHHEELIKDQLRVKEFSEQMLDYIESLKQNEFLLFVKALPPSVLKLMLDKKTTNGDAFLALAIKHKEKSVFLLDTVSSEELYDVFVDYVQGGSPTEMMSNIAWFSAEKLTFFQEQLSLNKADKTKQTVLLREMLDFLIKRRIGSIAIDIPSMYKEFNSYLFVRDIVRKQLEQKVWKVPSSLMSSLLWSAPVVELSTVTAVKKLDASAETAFELYQMINALEKKEKGNGAPGDWQQAEEKIRAALQILLVSQATTSPPFVLSEDEKRVYTTIYSAVTDRQSGMKVNMKL